MTTTYVIPAGGIRAKIYADATTANVVISGNATTSNITSNSSEVIVGATISKVVYGSAPNNAYWTITRGANVVGVYTGTGSVDYAALGDHMGLYPTANLTATLTGSANGFIIVYLQKTY
jgi:hypothetical protein